MFYSQLVLAKKGPLGKIWLAAHMDKKVPKLQIIQTNIPAAVENVMQPNVPMALRVSGHLLLGVVRVFSRKVTYLLTDCSDALIKIKDAFAKGQGGVELAPGAGTKNFEDITRQQEFDDEMDLDADLAQQAMLFATDEDDALAGIAIPDAPEDLFAADGFNVDEAEGFGANENFEVFFEQDDGAGKSKQRKGSNADEDGRASKRRKSGEEEDAPFGEENGEDILMGEEGGFGDVPFDDGLGADFGAAPARGGSSASGGGGFDAGFDEDDTPFPGTEGGALSGVMEDEMSPADDAALAAPKKGEKEKEGEKKRPKRKMQIDDETQLTTEFIRKGLNDTSDITRDFAAEEAAATKTPHAKAHSKASASDDPIFGPPCLPYLPAAVATMAVFQHAPVPAAKKQKLDIGKGRTASSGGGSEMPDNPDYIEGDENGRLSVERWRSAGQDDGAGVGIGGFDDPLAQGAQGRGSDAFGGRPQFGSDFGGGDFDEEMMGGGGFGEEMEDPSAGAGFGTSHQLPDVEGGDEEEQPNGATPSKKGKKGKKGAEEDASGYNHNPETWNARTKKMYNMLKDAYTESEDAPLSYTKMINQTRNLPNKRKIVAGCFQELLFLTTHGIIELDQAKAYGNIVVNKTELFETVKV